MRFGIIGTNTITEKLIDAGKQHSRFELKGVYSRTKERAEEFASLHDIPYTFTTIEALADSDHIDAVYIASPNAFHAEQASALMRKGKHVLCEKPMASNQREIATMIDVAKNEGVVLMEGIKSTMMPGFFTVQEHLHKLGHIRRYVGNFCKYSSRYDAYKEGEVLNAFKPSLSNGSLMDLGIYGIYPMVVLFGAPNSIKANGVFLESGVDGEGSVLAEYDDMEAVIMHSKIIDSHSPTEIQGENGTMIIPNISEPKEIKIVYRGGKEEDLHVKDNHPAMFYEVEEFIKLVEENKGQSKINSFSHTLMTARIMEEARQQIGLEYAADRKSRE
ncbi:Gfo/Idh/MocA family protein [Halobacillus litoralis]|uniref:Gfo/Idh/MocA family protein n=1 Tax=Halobacillus litoralis TaxID=45668 RepID=UPI002491C758|nr:Gfo/Idh/MocA family oxidoreductase [Halobacillus litoralis]